VVGSNGQDVQVPWFSGLCLEGKVAGQYEMERSDSQQEVQDTTKASLLELDGLAPITIFVGANNSGKSRLLRELFRTQKPVRLKLKSRDSKGAEVCIGSESPHWINKISRRGHQAGVMNGWIDENKRSELGAYLGQLNEEIARSNSQERESLHELQQKLSACGIKDKIGGLQDVKRCYVPILRGMRPPLIISSQEVDHESNKDLYEQRTLHDYLKDIMGQRSFSDKDNPRNLIFTGLGLYDNLRRRLLARTQAERKTVRDYELFLAEHFFPGQIVTLIPVEEGTNDVVHIRIGDNDERPIYDLGDGMQSLIICTYPIVTETEPGSLFFLEEPDLCMHPSLQRTFLEVLKIYHRKMGHQFFITTHSNHLLDLLEDNELVSIFSFSEIAAKTLAPPDSSQPDSANNSQSSKPKPSIRIRPSNLKDRQTLLELGVRPSATYLANATIWVEGVSDCAYLRAYMEAFIHYLKIRGNDWGKNGITGKSLAQRLEEYKEDRHYAFVEYSGANLTHFSFKDRDSDEGQGQATSSIVTNVPYLCSKAIVITDGDITDSNKGDRWKHFATQLDEHFIGLPCKEIENLIPDELMKSQILKDDPSIDTTKLTEINYADYRKLEMGVGDYLSTFSFVTKSYVGKSGTLTPYRKKMWSSNDKGIPWLVRQEVEMDKKRIKDGTGNPENTGNTLSMEDAEATRELPSYLTQDLIWLSVCLYAHIAECNHDLKTKRELNDFKDFIKRQGKILQAATVIQNDDSQPCPESDNAAESAGLEWPIKNINRICLLTAFLSESNKPE
jgi:AAA domain, putative AbiEii toxin, Type IV TA system